jgi:hypothetical protein
MKTMRAKPQIFKKVGVKSPLHATTWAETPNSLKITIGNKPPPFSSVSLF